MRGRKSQRISGAFKVDEGGIRAAKINREGTMRGRRERGGESDALRVGDVEKKRRKRETTRP